SFRRSEPPSFSPDDAAQQALAEYDRNGDGFLDAKELEYCPPLKNALRSFDKDGNGRLSAKEIAERLRTYQVGPSDRFSFPCQVSLDGRPLAAAVVTLVPEKFLGPAYRKAIGITDDNGTLYLKEEGQEATGVFSGLYRIEVSKKNAQGQETLPARYNKQSVLGQEVAPDTLGRGGDMAIALQSK